MKLYYKQQKSRQGFIFILLLGLMWTNIASYCLINDSCSIELLDPFDSESEKEENSEEKIDQEIRSNQNLASLFAFNASHKILVYEA